MPATPVTPATPATPATPCPRCSSPMAAQVDPDITIDLCPSCGGKFLDRGEFSVLATGMAGDLELVQWPARPARPAQAGEDESPPLSCPRCPERKMRRVQSLQCEDVVLDYCEGCGGYFLDDGEMKRLNAYLREVSGIEAGEEYRGHREGRLVRVDRVDQVLVASSALSLGTALGASAGRLLRVRVYFTAPLDLALSVYRETLPRKLLKFVRLSRQQDLELGDAEFDARFMVQGADPDGVRALLSSRVRKALLEFVGAGHKILTTPGSLSVLDDRLAYFEGPYSRNVPQAAAGALGQVMDYLTGAGKGKKPDVVAAAEPVIAGMLKLAGVIEG